MKKLIAALLAAATLTLGFVTSANASTYAQKNPNPSSSKPSVSGHNAHVTCHAAAGAKGKVRFNFRRKGFYTGKTVTYKPGVGFTAKGLKPGHYKVTISFKGANGWGNSQTVKWFWVK